MVQATVTWDHEALWVEYNSSLRSLREMKAGKHDGAEQRYGLAARRLVNAGLMNPIKRKYRGR
jgi:hypothetical protein